MKRFISNRIVLEILGIILFVILWQVLSMIVGQSTFIFPSPKQTIIEATKLLKDSYIYKCLWQTMLRMFGGFGLAFLLAFVFGIIAGSNEKIELVLAPTISILRSLPTATIVYFFLVIVGARVTPLFIVVLVSFPIIYESIKEGIKNTPIEYIEAATIDASSISNTILHVRLPLALPYILVGLVTSFALSLKIEIMAEVITGYTRLGLGSAILAAQRSDPTNMVPVFAYSLVAIILILIFDAIANVVRNKVEKSM